MLRDSVYSEVESQVFFSFCSEAPQPRITRQNDDLPLHGNAGFYPALGVPSEANPDRL